MENQQNLLRQVRNNKRILLAMLEDRSFIRKIYPGEANFVLIRVERADALLSFCAQRNVILRGFGAEAALRDCIRISVGSEEDLASLEAALYDWDNKR